MTKKSHQDGRRKLRFTSLDGVLDDAEAMATNPYHSLGNWSLGQVCSHLSKLMHLSIDGFPFEAPMLIRWMGPLSKKWCLARGFPSGVPLKNEASVLAPTPVADDQGLTRMRDAIHRLRREPARQRSPVFGAMSPTDWDRFHCRHAELHLSFIVPRTR